MFFAVVSGRSANYRIGEEIFRNIKRFFLEICQNELFYVVGYNKQHSEKIILELGKCFLQIQTVFFYLFRSVQRS